MPDPNKEVVEVMNASIETGVDVAATLKEAIETGMFREADIRPSVKLRNDAAKIAIAIRPSSRASKPSPAIKHNQDQAKHTARTWTAFKPIPGRD